MKGFDLSKGVPHYTKKEKKKKKRDYKIYTRPKRFFLVKFKSRNGHALFIILFSFLPISK